MNLGNVLKKWRAMSDLTIRDAAARMKLDSTTLQRVEQGRMPSAETLRAILLFLMAEPS